MGGQDAIAHPLQSRCPGRQSPPRQLFGVDVEGRTPRMFVVTAPQRIVDTLAKSNPRDLLQAMARIVR